MVEVSKDGGTVAFVQEWLMNSDYDPTQFDRGFAAAIDARSATLQAERDRYRDKLEIARQKFERIRQILVHNLDEPERSAFWLAVSARDEVGTALSDTPTVQS